MDEKKKNVLTRAGGFLFDLAAALVSAKNPKLAPTIQTAETVVHAVIPTK